MDSFIILTKKFKKEFKITSSEISIGRSLENTLCLNDESISRCHAKIIKKENKYYIVDMKSYNGTLVNGERIPVEVYYPLQNKDQIVLGDYQLACKFEEPSTPTPIPVVQESSIIEEMGFDLDSISQDPPQQNPPQQNPPKKAVRTTMALSKEMLPGLDSLTHQEEMEEPLQPKPILKSPTPTRADIPSGHDRLTMKIELGQNTESPPITTEALPNVENKEEISSLEGTLQIDDKGKLKTYHLHSPLLTLGRGTTNDITLSHFSVSKSHCEIRFEEKQFILYDLGTTNGTMVNDNLIQRWALNHKDTINIGQVYAVFHCKAFPALENEFESTFSEEEISWMLVKFRLLSKDQVKKALQIGKKQNKSLKQVLLSRNLVNPFQWVQAKEALEEKRKGGGSGKIILGTIIILLVLVLCLVLWKVLVQ